MPAAEPSADAYPALTLGHAKVVLAVFLATAILFVAVTLSPLRSGFADSPDRGPGDIALYQAEISRIRQGASYYDAAASELHERGYPTRNVFNWRTPLPVWLLAKMPELTAANALLGILALMLLVSSFALLCDDSGRGTALLGSALLIGALLPCLLGELVVMSELWAGVLVALSVVWFGLERRRPAIIAGVAALFFRELAAPYVLVCLAMAVWNRRWRELAGWGLGLAAYLAFFGFHLSQVLPRITAGDTAHAAGWIRFGGAGFLISTVQMNAYLLAMPQWATAIYLACSLLGCATWTSTAGGRIAFVTAVYCVAFSVAGHDFNQYWGSMIAPLLCLSACRAPATIRRLVSTVRQGALFAPVGRAAT